MSNETPKWVESNGSQTHEIAIQIRDELAKTDKEAAKEFWVAYRELNERAQLSDDVVKQGGDALQVIIKDAAKNGRARMNFRTMPKILGAWLSVMLAHRLQLLLP